MAGCYTVTQINSYIKHLFDEDFALSNITVKGEVSNCKYHTSGHIYFTLKDGGACLAAVMFAGNRSGLSFALKDGQKVMVSGSISVYERDGKYQIYAKKIKLDGEGDLYQRFLELKNELEEMGMFAPEYKKPIPAYAMKVGVITASTGAAVQDIINISRRRNPYVKLFLYPAIVQGAEAVPSIINGLEYMDRYGVDVIIVGRGGGSIEDLWAFNDEAVARAIFSCSTPVISAVGHETDTTIADYVADMRAPTPSAAAELAVFEYNRFVEDLERYRYTFSDLIHSKINTYETKLENYNLKLNNLAPVRQLQDKVNRLNIINEKLKTNMYKSLEQAKYRLNTMAEKLNAMSPLTRLDRGYAYVSTGQETLKSIEQIENGDNVTVHLRDGVVEAKAVNKKKYGE